jgi:carboxyl-terminal processing protease
MDKNRKDLEKTYKGTKKNRDFEYFVKNFEITDDLLKELVGFAEEEKLPFNEEEYNRSLLNLKTNLKALIARDVWETSEFFEIVNVLDPIYNEAVRVILNDDLYQSKLKPVKK